MYTQIIGMPTPTLTGEGGGVEHLVGIERTGGGNLDRHPERTSRVGTGNKSIGCDFALYVAAWEEVSSRRSAGCPACVDRISLGRFGRLIFERLVEQLISRERVTRRSSGFGIDGIGDLDIVAAASPMATHEEMVATGRILSSRQGPGSLCLGTAGFF